MLHTYLARSQGREKLIHTHPIMCALGVRRLPGRSPFYYDEGAVLMVFHHLTKPWQAEHATEAPYNTQQPNKSEKSDKPESSQDAQVAAMM